MLPLPTRVPGVRGYNGIGDAELRTIRIQSLLERRVPQSLRKSQILPWMLLEPGMCKQVAPEVWINYFIDPAERQSLDQVGNLVL